tara:strand:- start:4106 stop:4516 length:411 start_codon:yes stop_codon:yes gene_type:complete
MAKKRYTIRDWSKGLNNKVDPRDLSSGESADIKNMSIDTGGKIKTIGGLYAANTEQDSARSLDEYFVECTANISGSGGYGLFYFEADHSASPTSTITETKSGTPLALGTAVGNISFVGYAQYADDVTAADQELSPL